MSKRLTSLQDLPQDITPARNLFPAIESALRNEVDQAARQHQRRWRPSGMQISALAAVVAALAIGVVIGRVLLPSGATPVPAPVATTANVTPEARPAAFVTDPRYLQQRAALIRSHEEQLANLPPETRAKVVASLATIRQSMKEIEAALGRDPSNALLQELLVNTYQDEMRVLTTVQEAGAREI
jgi:hypothetical protein